MKRFFATIIVTLAVALSHAATNEPPAKLAIIVESPEAANVADLLTAEFTQNNKMQLLERTEIEKVYREQGLSAGKPDYLKLGQILGADGLLLLEAIKDDTNQSLNIPFATEKPLGLNTRLVAVKPGVVLAAEKFSLFSKDLAEWSSSFSKHLTPLLPKLIVLPKDAIPVSVVNLRSATAAAEALETERQVKTLVIQRLSQEPRLFVLERQQMQSLNEEKDLKSSESAFWNGSYLLEGIIDQNGLSPTTVTINARLTPAKGGAPILLEAAGSRTNLAEVINRLAAKVNETLKVTPASQEWKASDEAMQFFTEAEWALRWGMLAEAQAAGESSWALGKKDLEGARVRVTSYLYELPKLLPPNQTKFSRRPAYRCVHTDQPPDIKDCEVALTALKTYYEFSRSSPTGEPRILFRGKGWNDWHRSDWYELGLETLVASSEVLRHFHCFPESQKPAAGKLAELRAMARSAAALISQAPSVRDSYFVGDRIVSGDELSHNFSSVAMSRLPGYQGPAPNIFECAIQWGCFWQERPEDSLGLYRELMSAPLFICIHDRLWFREPDFPRLAAWNGEDNQRLPGIWSGFKKDLEASTNYFFRFEGEALVCADARAKAWAGKDPAVAGTAQIVDADAGWTASRAALLDFTSANYSLIVGENGNLPRKSWGTGPLLGENSEFGSRFAAIQQAYLKTGGEHLREIESRANFEKQKQYLAKFPPYDWREFDETFKDHDYTKRQATELLPLIAAYKSNLLAQVPSNASPLARMQADNSIRSVGSYLDQPVNAALNPPAPVQQSVGQPQIRPPSPTANPPSPIARRPPPPPSKQPPELVTNVLTITKFLPVPLAGLPGDQISGVTITAHHWLEGRLVLDLHYAAFVFTFDGQSNWQSTRTVSFPAIAILDPRTEHWEVISCPEVELMKQTRFYHHTTLLHGELFTSDGAQIKRYDFARRQWQVLPCSDGDNYELFAVSDHLYAANANLIFEITDGGKATRILASSRREPPVSVLDREDLGTPYLFAGPENSLRAGTRNKLFTWTGGDWRADSAAPSSFFPPVILPEGILFRYSTMGSGPLDKLSRLLQRTTPELCFGPKSAPNMFPMGPTTSETGEAIWKLPPKTFLENIAPALQGSNLYFLAGNSDIQPVANDQHEIVQEKVVARDGYNASLLCFSPDSPRPQKVFLNFDAPSGCPPFPGGNPDSGRAFPGLPGALLVFATENVLFASESPAGMIPTGLEKLPAGYQAGVWVMPAARLTPAIAAQKLLQSAESAQMTNYAAQLANDLLTKYDANNNKIIDPDERENALSDPAFIASALDAIDNDHSGWLDASELAWFDANQSKTLDAKELAAIALARNLLAGRLLGRFDPDGNGWLPVLQYDQMIEATLKIKPNVDFELQFARADANHDQYITQGEVADLMQSRIDRQLQRALPRQGPRPPGLPPPMGMPLRPAAFSGQSFPEKVEAYWKSPTAGSNQPPAGNPFHP